MKLNTNSYSKLSILERQQVAKWQEKLNLAVMNEKRYDNDIYDEEKALGWNPPLRSVHKPSKSLIEDTSSIVDSELKPKFYMGIEFEGLISDESYDSFVSSMEELGENEFGETLIQFGEDASIKDIPDGYCAVEIRTKALRSRAAMKLFEEMLCFLYLASQTNDFLTNKYCGLHINISEKKIFDEDKQIDFYCHVLKRFDEMSILENFGRVGNKYCLPFHKPGASLDVEDIKHQFDLCKRREKAAAERGDDRASRESKYFSVSLRNSPVHDGYEGKEKKNERIEFRCIGNKDYHLRFDDLNDSINHMISVIRRAYRQVI